MMLPIVAVAGISRLSLCFRQEQRGRGSNCGPEETTQKGRADAILGRMERAPGRLPRLGATPGRRNCRNGYGMPSRPRRAICGRAGGGTNDHAAPSVAGKRSGRSCWGVLPVNSATACRRSRGTRRHWETAAGKMPHRSAMAFVMPLRLRISVRTGSRMPKRLTVLSVPRKRQTVVNAQCF